MQRLFATVFAVTGVICLLGSTPGFARGFGHGAGAGIGRGAGVGIGRGAGVGIRRGMGGGMGRGAGLRQVPVQNRIPAPLAAPAQAPIINGPLNSNGMPSMGGGM
jgi:hypothetical protein